MAPARRIPSGIPANGLQKRGRPAIPDTAGNSSIALENCSCVMGYGTPKKVSRKVARKEHNSRQKAASFAFLSHPIARKGSPFWGFKKIQSRRARSPRVADMMRGDSLKMEALNPSLETRESELVQKAGAGCRAGA